MGGVWRKQMKNKVEDLFGEIEAQQSLIAKMIEENKHHCSRNEMLVDAAAKRRRPARESEGELEDA